VRRCDGKVGPNRVYALYVTVNFVIFLPEPRKSVCTPCMYGLNHPCVIKGRDHFPAKKVRMHTMNVWFSLPRKSVCTPCMYGLDHPCVMKGRDHFPPRKSVCTPCMYGLNHPCVMKGRDINSLPRQSVCTPCMYGLNHPCVMKGRDHFPAKKVRMYTMYVWFGLILCDERT
jgi:hypothetical protein